MKVDIILPIYNEEKILATNALALFNFCQQHLIYDWQIILVINGCGDDSLNIAEKLIRDQTKFKLIKLTASGKGRALKAGLTNSQADVTVYMDIDLAVDLQALCPLINLLAQENYEIALGSRLLKDSQTERSLLRETSSRAYNRLANFILKNSISDWQCGFKALKPQAIKNLLPFVKDDEWFFDTELLAWASQTNLKIAEMPVAWSENRYAVRRSKIRPVRDGWVFLKNLLKLKNRLKNTHLT